MSDSKKKTPKEIDMSYCTRKLNEAVGILKGTNTPEEIQLAGKNNCKQ